MSRAATGSARVVNVAAGVENSGQTAPVRDGRHQALGILVGKWINATSTAHDWRSGATCSGGPETGRVAPQR